MSPPDVSDAVRVVSWVARIAIWTIFMAALWRRAWRQSSLHVRVLDGLGALVCAAILLFGLVHGIPERQPRSVWETDSGRQMQASFLSACRHGYYGSFACDCLFERLTSRPPGSTATGFTMLTQQLRYAELRDDAQQVRSPAAAAVTSCRRGA